MGMSDPEAARWLEWLLSGAEPAAAAENYFEVVTSDPDNLERYPMYADKPSAIRWLTVALAQQRPVRLLCGRDGKRIGFAFPKMDAPRLVLATSDDAASWGNGMLTRMMPEDASRPDDRLGLADRGADITAVRARCRCRCGATIVVNEYELGRRWLGVAEAGQPDQLIIGRGRYADTH